MPVSTERRSVLALLIIGMFFSLSADSFAQDMKYISVYCGGAGSDFGGKSGTGISFGVAGLRKQIRNNIHMMYGLEYIEKINSGTVSQYSSADGSLIFEGEGEVSLKYLQLMVQWQYTVKYSEMNISPYVGFAPSLLLDQSIDTVEDSGSTFSGLDWYGVYNLAVLAGVNIGIGQGFLDFQITQGLTDMKSGEDRPDGDWPPHMFTDRKEKGFSYRLAAGVAF